MSEIDFSSKKIEINDLKIEPMIEPEKLSVHNSLVESTDELTVESWLNRLHHE